MKYFCPLHACSYDATRLGVNPLTFPLVQMTEVRPPEMQSQDQGYPRTNITIFTIHFHYKVKTLWVQSWEIGNQGADGGGEIDILCFLPFSD